MSDAQLLVAGGGPVGLATAIEARLAGIDVLVVEPRDGVIDKACGEGVMPGAREALDRLGVAPASAPIAGIDYRDVRHSVQHRFSGGPGQGIRRTTLHAALLERARELGVRWVRARVVAVEPGGTSVAVATDAGSRLVGGWLVAADGLHSTVARSVGLALPEPRARRRYGQRRHYRLEPWTDLVEVHWTGVGEFYVTPLAGGVVGVSLLARRGVHYEQALAASGELAERIAGADAVSELRGAGPFRQRTRARVAGRVLLVGDASGYVDALTAEGIRIGLESAHEAVAAICAGRSEQYEAAWGRTTRAFRRMTAGLVRVAESPLRGLVVPAAARMPRLYASGVERIAR
ncbi:NAD(P)/FAD-dependent oxidoreductase [Protaetiibacter larvae]|uniref:NAD(P)/FAD-dependent oxidoreductase n=1 Tax=Protaetiibacter larvae TaxID=2592654 RepID=A0A5C1Y6W8_9MICO|nr:NAD(P)/FAD-dependent oxidoreductase [Protaetiibacter larvae]QEO09079.1 NAD(P)/FAD-dependent oxidoreductase [Protaetiibacter larvae]